MTMAATANAPRKAGEIEEALGVLSNQISEASVLVDDLQEKLGNVLSEPRPMVGVGEESPLHSTELARWICDRGKEVSSISARLRETLNRIEL